jgi:preprotein translocase subunit SecG
MGCSLHARQILLVKKPESVFLIDKLAIFVNQRNIESRNVFGVGPAANAGRWRYHPPMYTFLGFLQVIISGILIFLILLHSGKDTGLSGAFGIGGGGSSFGGGSMVERNLDRATIFFAVIFVLNTFVLLKI